MKIPKKLILLGEIYDIKLVTQNQMNKLDGDTDTLGWLCPKERKIYIVDDDEKENTFWHELGHYFLQVFGYKDNEQGASAFGEYITNILKQIK